MTHLVVNNTHKMLRQWSIWCDRGMIQGLGYPSVSSIVPPHFRRKNNKKYKLWITDEEAMNIDKILAKLLYKFKETGEAVILYYFCGCNLSKTARQLKVDDRKANIYIKSGVAWIDAILFPVSDEELSNFF